MQGEGDLTQSVQWRLLGNALQFVIDDVQECFTFQGVHNICPRIVNFVESLGKWEIVVLLALVFLFLYMHDEIDVHFRILMHMPKWLLAIIYRMS